jgi:tRNA modification GTPase
MDTTGYTPEEPVAAIATALAPAALGIVRTSGKGSIELLSRIFSRPKLLKAAAGNSIVYGWIVDRSEECERRIDEVLVSVFRAPKSFTGEDMAEISCHGGTAVILSIFTLLLKNGFRQAQRGEFTFRAYINGKTDLTRAEAVREIIDSRTDAARSRAAGRLSGDLYEQIDRIKKDITDTLAAVEVEIEYPEDEETIADTFDRQALEKAAQDLSELSLSWKSEKLYQDGARVVLCGKTNAGKSSLFNILLKEERAIVSDIAGTTRDWIESWADFDGIPARLFDTAGIRETTDIIEKTGVERTRDLSSDADIILYLADSSVPIDSADLEFLAAHPEPVIFVWNKCDRADCQYTELTETEKIKIPGLRSQVRISAKCSDGLSLLVTEVKKELVGGTASDRGRSGLGSQRQKEAVDEALESVRHALQVSADNYTLDAVVQDLEDSLDALGRITGEVTPEDVLGSIFSHFCVGK